MEDKINLIPSHAVGSWILGIIHSVLDRLGLEHTSWLEESLYIAVVLVVSLGFGWVIKKCVIALLRKFVSMRHSEAGRQFLNHHVISSCAHFIPPLVFLGFMPIAFSRGNDNHLLVIIERLVGAYTLVTCGMGLTAIGRFIFFRYNLRENTRNLPIKGILNISLGVIWIVITIIAVSILLDKSPAILLTGLGAFAAALMLIFKDSILGFVAGIQMSQNDMLHVGDWIVVPGTPANGIVLDVTLSAVKIRNFDNTIVTVPPYTLVSTTFQNYRGMVESGARRFTRTIIIDTPTIQRLTPAMLDGILKAHPELQGFVSGLNADKHIIGASPGVRPLNGTVETNLGLFRAYCSLYLMNSPLVDPSSRVLVRVLEPTDQGFPLDIYAFARTTDWGEYEAIQSAVMEHLATTAPDFGLVVYTSGAMTVDEVSQPAPQAAGDSGPA